MRETIIAQYTIRGKQDYIFQTNKILEIIGGSINISQAWNKLFEQAEELNMRYERISDTKDFNLKTVEEQFAADQLDMVELFCGGGNETILFKNFSTYVTLNRHFTYTLLKNCPGMIPMMVCTKVTGDYQKDYQRLMQIAEQEKNVMISGQEFFVLPFSMMERETFRPYTKTDSRGSGPQRFSEESYTKYIVGFEERTKDNSIKLLDDMVTSKGEESILAVVHADGNNMGSKIMDMLKGHIDYDYCIRKMRKFTIETKKVFGEIGLKALKNKKEELMKKYEGLKESSFAYRVIIKDGDDMTFICNARFVMEYVCAYINAVQNYQSEWNYSSCAGICIFHSHYPFAKAYALAEQACDDSAKSKVHQIDENGKPRIIEEGWVDFHYIHSGIGGSLEGIRHRHNSENCMARPWCISGNNETVWNISKLKEINRIVEEYKISRSNIKGLGIAIEDGLENGRKELRRIYGHNKGFEQALVKIFPHEDDLLKTMYDFAEVYDLWYKEAK